MCPDCTFTLASLDINGRHDQRSAPDLLLYNGEMFEKMIGKLPQNEEVSLPKNVFVVRERYPRTRNIFSQEYE
jgi:hypothetical protein